ncbi:MAG TPA: hypothetical protein VF223_24875 [Trebonia sp.]
MEVHGVRALPREVVPARRFRGYGPSDVAHIELLGEQVVSRFT